MVEKARRQLTLARNVNQSDPADWQKLNEMEPSGEMHGFEEDRRLDEYTEGSRRRHCQRADSSQLVTSLIS